MGLNYPKMPEGTKPFLLGAAVGAFLFAWAGFDLLGWKSDSTAKTLAQRQADGAVIAALAPVCLAQFKAGPNLPARMAVLEKTDKWSRGEVISKGGYATMVGSKDPLPGVGQACAELLLPDKTL